MAQLKVYSNSPDVLTGVSFGVNLVNDSYIKAESEVTDSDKEDYDYMIIFEDEDSEEDSEIILS